MNFENKTAVVTGGSRGIGLAIAKKLAQGGANIAVLYVGDESEGQTAVRELEQHGTKVKQYLCNVFMPKPRLRVGLMRMETYI